MRIPGGISLTTGKRSTTTAKRASGSRTKKPSRDPAVEPVPVLDVSESGHKKERPSTSVKTETLLPEPEQEGKAGRPFWSGTLSIGLVSVPVRLHTMVKDRSFSFRLLHKEDGQPLRYDRVCSKDGKVIPWNEIVKGYEVRKGEFVVFESEELKAIMPESSKKIRIGKFVHFLSLDPVYFDTPYILIPDGSEDAYSLLLTALQDLGMAAVGTITLRTKEHPVVVHVYKGALILTTLRYAGEVTLPRSFALLSNLPSPKDAELALAKRIVNELSGDFSIGEFHDHYEEEVKKLVAKKVSGEKIILEKPRAEEAKEMMQALKETLATLSKP